MTEEELKEMKETAIRAVESFWNGKPLTKEDLTKLMMFHPWSTYNTPYWTLERMKSFVIFRYERMKDEDWILAYGVIRTEEDVRRELKKLRKQENAAKHQPPENKKGPPQGGPMGGSSNNA